VIWVVDNFYKNPDKIREQALKLDYVRGAGTNPPKVFHAGFRHTVQNDPNWWHNRIYLRNRVASISGLRPTDTSMKAMGAFNIGYAEKRNRYNWIHSDSNFGDDRGISKMYAFVIYLTPNPPKNTGTLLFEDDKGNITNTYPSKKAMQEYENPHFYGSFWDSDIDKDKWKVHCKVENRYNRLIMYDATYLHTSEDGGFGDTKETARLTQIGFWYGED